MKAARVICQQIFSIFVLAIVLFEIPFRKVRPFFSHFGVEIPLWRCNFRRRCV